MCVDFVIVILLFTGKLQKTKQNSVLLFAYNIHQTVYEQIVGSQWD